MATVDSILKEMQSNRQLMRGISSKLSSYKKLEERQHELAQMLKQFRGKITTDHAS